MSPRRRRTRQVARSSSHSTWGSLSIAVWRLGCSTWLRALGGHDPPSPARPTSAVARDGPKTKGNDRRRRPLGPRSDRRRAVRVRGGPTRSNSDRRPSEPRSRDPRPTPRNRPVSSRRRTTSRGGDDQPPPPSAADTGTLPFDLTDADEGKVTGREGGCPPAGKVRGHAAGRNPVKPSPPAGLAPSLLDAPPFPPPDGGPRPNRRSRKDPESKDGPASGSYSLSFCGHRRARSHVRLRAAFALFCLHRHGASACSLSSEASLGFGRVDLLDSPAAMRRTPWKGGGQIWRDRLTLSGSTEQAVSTAYTTDALIQVVCKGSVPARRQIAIRRQGNPALPRDSPSPTP
jgi:hypothetical protein